MPNVAAIHLITANEEIGCPVLSASILVFGDSKAREDFVISNWYERLEEHGDDFFSESNRDHILFLVNSGAEIIDESLLVSRILGAQARHLCNGTIWQSHFHSHVSHYAYLFALVSQKRDIMRKGFNVDALVLNAANRLIAEEDKNFPTGASSPEAGLYYLKSLYIGCKRLLGHDVDDDGVDTIRRAAPKLTAAVKEKPMNQLTLPPLPTKVSTLPPLPTKVSTLPPLPTK